MTLRRALLAWLAFALVAAQSLAFMHRVVHGPQAQLSSVSQVSQTHASWTAALFANHDDDSSCRLFDALGHDAAPSAPVVVLPLALPAFTLLLQQHECIFRFSALFDARGPPPIR